MPLKLGSYVPTESESYHARGLHFRGGCWVLEKDIPGIETAKRLWKRLAYIYQRQGNNFHLHVFYSKCSKKREVKEKAVQSLVKLKRH